MKTATLRAWWWHRQGLDGTLQGATAEQVLARSGWARSVGGVGPYLTLFSRAGISRAQADAAVASLRIHELPAVRGCTYVVAAEDYALALSLADAAGGGEMRVARALGVTTAELDTLCAAVLGALAGDALTPDQLRTATGGASRSLGDAGRTKGLSTTLPLALGRLQREGHVRRVPVDGRLDQQRYAYARWHPNPRRRPGPADTERYSDLARRFFRWVGPATLGEWQWFSGLGVRASQSVLAPLALVPAWDAADRLLLPSDADEWRAFEAPATPQYALVGSLDSIVATRRDFRSLLDDDDVTREVVENRRVAHLGALSDLPSHAILDRGRLIGLWEYDAEAQQIVWATFGGGHEESLREVVHRTAVYVRDDLGDARAFSLDSPVGRQPRLAALRAMALRAGAGRGA